MEFNEQSVTLHQYLNSVITNIPYGILTISRELEVVMLNSIVLSLLDIDNKDLNNFVDKPYKNIFYKIPQIIDLFEENILRKKNKSFEFHRLKLNSKTLNIKCFVMPKGTLFIIEDFTFQVQQEENLREINANLEKRVEEELNKNRLKDQLIIQQSRLAQMGEMIAMIAHQWRQPLSSISMAANNIIVDIELDMLDNQVLKDEANSILSQIQELSQTIDDFRNFFKENNLKEITTIDKIVESTLDIVSSSLINNNIELIINLCSKADIQTYHNEVKQVLLNIIQNAKDALLTNKIKNPIITINTKDNEITIKDNAGGISDDIIHKIFDPYFSTKTKMNGTGLGLYMSKTIIEDHCNAKLNVENTEDGALFKITF